MMRGALYIDPEDGMLYRYGERGMTTVGKAQGYEDGAEYDEKDDDEEEEEDEEIEEE